MALFFIGSFITGFTLNNFDIIALKIFFLSKSQPNVWLISSFYIFVNFFNKFNNVSRVFTLIGYLLLYVKFSFVQPALTNTLFSIHPPMLYITAIICLSHLSRWKHARGYSQIYNSLFITMVFGGWWAMQELSWGGWWNWDVLEVGILYCVLIALVNDHMGLRNSLSVRQVRSIRTLLTFMSYVILNKLGLGISIHSFVLSKDFSVKYFNTISVFAVASVCVYSKKINSFTLLPVIGSLLYLSIQTYDALKKLICSSLIYVLSQKYRFGWMGWLVHKPFVIFIFLIFFINFNNGAFFVKEFCRTFLFHSQCNSWFYTLSYNKFWDASTRCHTTTLLNKPRLFIGGQLSLSQFRSNVDKHTLQFFLK